MIQCNKQLARANSMPKEKKPKPKAKAKKKVGRPADYTNKLADDICERLANGESMRSVCRDDKTPAMTTVFRWLREKPDFKQQYAIATEERAEAMVEDMVDIADNANNDWMEQNGDSDGYRLNGESIQRSKLRVDTRKWAASKLKPKKYGDKIQQEISGSLDLTNLTDDELDLKIKMLLKDN